MKLLRQIYVPYTFLTKVGGNMDRVLANSSSVAQIVILDDDLNRVSNAVVTLSIVRPDTNVQTVTALDVPLYGDGLYKVVLPATAFPLPLRGYEIDWTITIDTDEYNPTDFVNVWMR